MSAPTLSVVLSFRNEADVIPELIGRLAKSLEGAGIDYELIFVNDASTDRSLALLEEHRARDPRVKIVNMSRRFGVAPCVIAGLHYARGQAVVYMDTDLQDPPELIPELAAKWRDGYEVVYAVRAEREGETWFKLATASLFYRIIYRITDVKIPLDTGDFRLLDRKVVDALKQMRERHRFLRGMAAWVGFRQIGVPYKRAARVAGETKYPFRKMFRLAVNAITGYSYFPLQLATYFGFACAALSALCIPFVIAMRLTGNQAFLGQATTLIAVLFLGGVQLICVGILGEYIGRLYDEAKGRPLYIVRQGPDDPTPVRPAALRPVGRETTARRGTGRKS